ncbi:hypothetical protein LguiA_034499 [Lonicera macranthoides]
MGGTSEGSLVITNLGIQAMPIFIYISFKERMMGGGIGDTIRRERQEEREKHTIEKIDWRLLQDNLTISKGLNSMCCHTLQRRSQIRSSVIDHLLILHVAIAKNGVKLQDQVRDHFVRIRIFEEIEDTDRPKQTISVRLVVQIPVGPSMSVQCEKITHGSWTPSSLLQPIVMWKLKIADGNGPWLTTTNNHVGRQHWEFDPEEGTPEERARVEKLRDNFKKNRFQIKQSSDLLMRIQIVKWLKHFAFCHATRDGKVSGLGRLNKENISCGAGPIPPAIKLEETEEVTVEAVTSTLRRGIGFYSTIQAHDGHWPAESAGPLFFLPPLVIALYITGAVNAILSPEHQKEIIRYIYNHQNGDGGWGIHIEGHSTVFGSCLSYIALRLLGEGHDDGEDRAVARGRKWILDHGGAVLGVYEWGGNNPMPPEFWLLPKIFPIHPGVMFACNMGGRSELRSLQASSCSNP